MTQRMRSVCAALLCSAGLGLATSAQSISTLVLEGDPVPGVGNVTSIYSLAVNASGSWIAEIDTDHANPDADGVLLKDGQLYLREGQAMRAPVGGTLGAFDSVSLNAAGHSASNFYIKNTNGFFDDSGVYFDDVLVIQESDLSGAAGFSAGTQYVGIWKTKLNAANQILVVASVDDPAIASPEDRALVIATVDNSGVLQGEVVVAKEGDVLPGQTESVTGFGLSAQSFDFNDSGQVLSFATLTGSTAADTCLYLDGTLLAQEGSPSPVPGRNWYFFPFVNVGLSNTGHWVHAGLLDGSASDDAVLIRDGALFRQEGETLPAFAPYRLTGFGFFDSAPVEVDSAGNVLWFGEWDSPDSDRDSGLFLGDLLLVREGVTLIGGQRVTKLPGSYGSFAFSPDGRYVVFRATLEGGVDGVFQLDLQGACPAALGYCTATPSSIPGCVPTFATTGTPSASAGSGFQVDCGPVPGGNVGLFLYTTNGAATSPLGTPFGFLCIQGGPGLRRIQPGLAGGQPGTCSGDHGIEFNAYFATQTIDPTLVAGATVDLQVWYRDPPNPGNANFSGALHFALCP